MKKWSRQHDCCVRCGGTDYPHQGRELCRRCYWTEQNPIRHAAHREEERQASLARYYANREEWQASHREWYARNADHARAYSVEYRRHHIDEARERERVYRAENRLQRLRQSKTWREQNPERVRENFARWAARQDRHFKRPQEYWRNRYHLLIELDLPCALCGSRDRREAHHLVSVGDGGSHELANLQVLCFTCHRGSETGVHSSR